MSSTTDQRMGRRSFLASVIGGLAAFLAAPGDSAAEKIDSLAALAQGALGQNPGNFWAVYSDPSLRDEFFLFLQNVYRLYPEAQFHQLIIDSVKPGVTDAQIYETLLQRLPALKPMFGDLTYSLPALVKQKDELARETLQFLGPDPSANGFLEIGSPGRYASALKERMRLTGKIYLLHDQAPSYSPPDIMERGGLRKIGDYIPMGNYDSIAGKVPERSLDLILNYIGFHHCTLDRLDAFVAGLRNALRPGGRLILRDHDVDTPARWSIVALAHDVFNAGLFIPWKDTHAQVRLFRPVRDWNAYMTAHGFKRVAPDTAIAQAHDPTHNLLMMFERTA